VIKVALASVGLLAILATQANAEIIQFNLVGKAGTGLLSGNENGTVLGTPGSGGEIGAGITFDTATNILTVIAGWGTANGFTNLSGNALAGHLHGPVGADAPAAFTLDATVKYGLDDKPGWNPAAGNGGFNGTVSILTSDTASLLAGRFYMNVHTGTNAGGEIRGNLVVVPEPSSIALALSGAALLALRRSRKPAK
jgi:hypothetical protein